MLRDEWYNRTQTKPSSSEVVVREENKRGSDYNAYLSKVFGGLDNIKISYSGGSDSKIVVVGSSDDTESETDTKSASTVDHRLKSLFAISPVRPSISRTHSIRETEQPPSVDSNKTRAKEESNEISNYIVDYEMEGGGNDDGHDDDDEPTSEIEEDLEIEPINMLEEDHIEEPEQEQEPESQVEDTQITDFIKTDDLQTNSDDLQTKSEEPEDINEFIKGGEEIDQPDCDLLENKEVPYSEDNIL